MTDLMDRLINRIDFSDKCWLWTGYLTPKGYGKIAVKGRSPQRVHRLVYEMAVGPIPDGLTLDHLCGNKACCNPDHLEPVTAAENTRRAHTKTHCLRDHEFTAENTYYRPDGSRLCRACMRFHASAHYHRNRP